MKRLDAFFIGLFVATLFWAILIAFGAFWKCPYQDDDSANSYTLSNLETIQERADYYNGIISKIKETWASKLNVPYLAWRIRWENDVSSDNKEKKQ